jgi:hypothetical protein
METTLTQTQTDLETLYSKHQLLPVLREEFTEYMVENHPDVVGYGSGGKPFVEMLAQIYLHRQADPITMVGILSPKFGDPQEVSDLLWTAVSELDLMDFDPEKDMFMVKFDISEDVQDRLDRYQYPLPMITPPNVVKDNFQTGYETIKNPVILNGSNYFKDKDVCLDHLNRANAVALTLDVDVVKSPEGKYVQPKRNVGEEFTDFNKRKRQANIFYHTSVKVMADLFDLSKELYLTHRFDRRGRTYASGYHVTTQGTDYNKAVLQLAKKELIK